MSGLRVAIATCAPFPPVADDEGPLRAAFAARGVAVDDVPWDADVAWGAFDACLIRTTWDYQERKDAFVAWAERAAEETLLLHGPAVVRWNTDKRYLRELEAAGAPLTPTIWLDAGEGADVAARVREAGWGRAFLKPVVGANARETLRFDADAAGLAAAQAHADRLLLDAGEGLMLQPYLESVERDGERSLILVDGAFAHGVRKIPVPGDYRVQDDWGATDVPWLPTAEEQALAARIVALAGARLGEALVYARVDLLTGPGGERWLNELEIVEPSLFFRHGPA
ncbi:MAG: hypothetical protein KC635_27290, partial [Myxococcales bacterium]|nr:hypothetical protein [Myxococcales bacterium]